MPQVRVRFLDANLGATTNRANILVEGVRLTVRPSFWELAVPQSGCKPSLIRRSFSVEVGNTILAGVSEPPSRIYFGPRIQARVSPTLEGSGVPAGLAAFDHVEAMRGAMNDFVVRMALLQEGYFAVNGVRAGFGRSFLTGWEFLGPRTGMPATLGTTVGSLHPPTAPLRLEWDAPDRVTLSGRQDYYVSLLIYVRTAYSDGQVRDRAVASTIAVSVGFPAQAG